DRSHKLPLNRQCAVLEICRSSAYRSSPSVSEDDLELMEKIDVLHLRHPFKGLRRLRDDHWDDHDLVVNRKRIRRLMRLMGTRALYPGAKTTKKNPEHKVYPYLLRDLEVNEVNQVWCTDITYIPMRNGFLYLVAIMDWHSRKVLSWRLPNSLETEPCIEALEEALAKYGTPGIFNSNQGSQFTSDDFTKVLKKKGIDISMDGKGRWRSLKYEEVYLKAYESVAHAKESIGIWLNFYNQDRRHANLKRMTPDQV
ncbi:MAG: IS3 family transposase, partial [Nitrospirae bacterium]|nr:IS3 family transposase [Candidatus Manganitrophaceae bacterium]